MPDPFNSSAWAGSLGQCLQRHFVGPGFGLLGYRVILKALGKTGKSVMISWSEWQDLNLRPLRPERSALPG
jgi:hypothetical protein